MRVTELRQLSPDRFELGLSDGTSLRVGLNQIADFSLFAGRELTEAELEELREAAALQRTKERALRIIGQRAMSEGELYTRLTEKGETEQNAAAAVAWLIGLHLLSDADYAALVARHYAARGYGRRRVEQELYRRQVPKPLWEAALAELPEPDDALDRLLQSRLRGAEPDDRKALKRATDALLRRGYGWEEIREAVERYRAGLEEEREPESSFPPPGALRHPPL